MSIRLRSLSVFVALAAAWITGGSANAQAPGPRVTYPIVTKAMTGLDNPRGLAFGPEGALYVAEAGRGGAGPCIMLRGAQRCYGASGAVTRLWRGIQERVATNFPSYADPTGEAIGPHDIAFGPRGGAILLVGTQGDPAVRSQFGPDGPLFGTLVRANAAGGWDTVADVSAYETAANPDGGMVDSNPYRLFDEPVDWRGPRERGVLLVDAGANALLRVAEDGQISTVAVFPSRSSGRETDSVPTAVVAGPDGALYVSELTGVPFGDTAARIYRVVPGSAPEVFLEGFKTIVDFAFAPDGTLYVLQHSSAPAPPTPPFFTTPGQVIRVARNGTRTVVYDALTRPTAIAIDRDGAIYVSNFGPFVGTGEVLKIVEDPIGKSAVTGVPGGILLGGAEGVVCRPANEGALRYSFEDKAMVYCDGERWMELKAEPARRPNR